MVTTPNIRRWMIIAVAAALVVLVISFIFVTMGGNKACRDLPYDITPMIAFELSRSAQDLANIFGASPSICQVQLARAFDRINSLDYLYMPAYALMLFAFIAGLAAGRRDALIRFGLACAILAPAADAVENVALLTLTKNLSAPDAWLAWLRYPVHMKFLGITLAGVVAGLLLWRNGGPWQRVAGLLLLPQFMPALITIFAPISYSAALLTPLIAFSWLLTLLLALIGTARPDLLRTSV